MNPMHPNSKKSCTKSLFLLLIAAVSAGSHGQSQMPDVAPTAHDNVPAISGNFGEALRPTVKSAAAAKNKPYNPIRKSDDQGNIPEIEMFVGESRLFPAPGVARIAVGNGQIMTANSLDKKEVIIFANAVGTSSLFIWNEDGRYQRVKINIVPGDTSRFAREIAAFLSGIPNAKASVIGDKVIVEGDNLSDLDISKIDELAKRYPQIVNFTNRLGWEQMILLDVKVVEFPVNELREIGLKWGARGGAAIGGIWGPIAHGNSLGNYQLNLETGAGNRAPMSGAGGSDSFPIPSGINIASMVNLGLNAQLNLLAQNGQATILAEPQLSARNGAKATFLAGGEYPYTVSTFYGPTIMFKPYGVKLEIVPRVDRQGVIRATIDSEVSAIDTSLSTLSGPALSTRRTNTEFNVRNGETLVLAGLLSRNSSTNIDKVPFLGDIPILGALFRSKRFQNDETELVIFVTPTIVDSRSPGLVERVERTQRKLQDALGRPPYLSNPVQPGRDPASPSKPTAQPAQSSLEPGKSGTSGSAVEPAQVTPLPAPESIRPAESSTTLPPGVNPLKAAANAATLRVKVDGSIVRSAPTRSGTSLVLLGRDSIVTAGPQGNRNGWRHVVIGNIEGWIATRSLEASDRPPAIVHYSRDSAGKTEHGEKTIGASPGLADSLAVTADHESAESGRRYRVSYDQLALRVAPDVNASIIQGLAFNTQVEATPQPPRNGWVAVRAGEHRGWVFARWLVPDGAEKQ